MIRAELGRFIDSIAGSNMRILTRALTLVAVTVQISCGSGSGVGTTTDDPPGTVADCTTNWQARCAEASAYWLSADTIAWSGGSADSAFTLHASPDASLNPGGSGPVGGEVLALTLDPAGLPPPALEKFPHLAGHRALKLDASVQARVPQLLKGQLAVSVSDATGNLLDATGLQLPGVLDELFTYEGPLGVSFEAGVPMFRLWAPTARRVTLQVFDTADAAAAAVTLVLEERPGTGVWEANGEPGWLSKYYLYSVDVYVPATGRIETNSVTDPYSVSLAADSARSQIVDLADSSLMPAGWETLTKPEIASAADISIYELHVRDYSIADASVPQANRGTFSAFTFTDSNGFRHLRALADAGLTHLHLLPAFDFATVPERLGDQRQPDRAELNSLPPDSSGQQALIEAIKEEDGFNWGYDPWHYTVPEGSFAVNPDGASRILEFRGMVKALNEAGLNVVMDVVYNHTSQSGQAQKSVLDKIVPGYYQRLNAAGTVETSTCCANTATEHAMMEKLMIDSVLTWARGYKVDGFRFDLMGHHSKANMLRLRAALDALTLAGDGVDGKRIYLYGEGWNFGEVADNARFEQATQANMAGTGIGTFFDRLRDGARGGTPFIDPREQGFINGLGYDPNAWEAANGDDDLAELRRTSDWIRVGLSGGLADYRFENALGDIVAGADIDYLGAPAGYTAQPFEQITYVAAHDNETLFDVIQVKSPANANMAARVRMQNLANSLVVLSQGVPFLHAGQDLLRSKSMDRDSFNSGDWFNELDWTLASSGWGRGLPVAEKNADKWPLMRPLLSDPALVPRQADREFARAMLRELLQIRGSSGLFRLGDAEQIKARLSFHNTGPDQLPGLIVMSLEDPDGSIDPLWSDIVVLFNANDEALNFQWPAGSESFVLHPVQAASLDSSVRTARFDLAGRRFMVPARTTAVFVSPR